MRKAILGCLALILVALTVSPKSSHANRQEPDESLIERGRYLAAVIGSCIDCHTPHVDQKPDPSRLFSGHPQDAPAPRWDPSLAESNIGLVISPLGTAFSGPRGVSFASNLTPDPNTGLGAWNESLFIRTMRRGDFQIPMPVHLKEISRNDLKAIWAYLQTLESIYNAVPKSQLTDAPQE